MPTHSLDAGIFTRKEEWRRFFKMLRAWFEEEFWTVGIGPKLTDPWTLPTIPLPVCPALGGASEGHEERERQGQESVCSWAETPWRGSRANVLFLYSHLVFICTFNFLKRAHIQVQITCLWSTWHQQLLSLCPDYFRISGPRGLLTSTLSI